MASVIKLSHTVSIGGRNFSVKRVDNFFAIYSQSLVEAVTNQLRVLAYKGRDLLVDKLLARNPLEGNKILYRPEDLQKDTDVVPEPPYESANDTYSQDQNKKNKKLLPKRKYRASLEDIRPFTMRKLGNEYLKKKIRRGEDPRILLATGDYAIGIVVRKVRTHAAGVYYKVTTARRKHRPSGLPLSKIARIHEYGVANMKIPVPGDEGRKITIMFPARPHWRPTFLILQKVAKSMGEDISAEALKESLKKLQ